MTANLTGAFSSSTGTSMQKQFIEPLTVEPAPDCEICGRHTATKTYQLPDRQLACRTYQCRCPAIFLDPILYMRKNGIVFSDSRKNQAVELLVKVEYMVRYIRPQFEADEDDLYEIAGDYIRNSMSNKSESDRISDAKKINAHIWAMIKDTERMQEKNAECV